MRRNPVAAIALLLLLSVSACAEPNAKEAIGNTDAAKATEDAPSNADIEQYFEALTSGKPDEIETVRSAIVEPGSLADAYTSHQINQTNSLLDAGYPPDDRQVKNVDGGYEICATEEPEKGTDRCTTFTEIESKNGKLADFTVGGNDLRDRVSVGDGSKKSAGPLGSVEFLNAYQAVSSGDLIVHVRIKTKDQELSGPYSARYRSPEGRQSTATAVNSPEVIEPDSTVYVSFYFANAKPGGRVTVPMADPDYTFERTVKFKTR